MLFVAILSFLILHVCPSAAARDPRLVIFPSQGSILAPAGRPFGLMCRGEADFTNMQWISMRGEIIPKGIPGVKEYGQHSLKLSFVNPKAEDSGLYKCTALYESAQTLEAYTNLTFYEDIRFEDCEPMQRLVSGREGFVRCRPLSHPPPQVLWEKDGRPLRTAVTATGLRISFATEEDSGIYTVEAFVPTTGVNKYRNITVQVFSSPRIVELPEELLLTEGEEYTIICRAQGSEPLAYSWFDSQLRDLSVVDGFRVEAGFLTILRADRKDEGEYRCRVSNPSGQDEAVFRIRVQVRPRIVRFENVTREEGRSVELECRAEGVPRPRISFRKNDSSEPLLDGQEERIELEEEREEDSSVLRVRISNLERRDDGLYWCAASNDAGEAELAARLEVQFKPDMTLTPTTRMKVLSGHPANLSCVAEANPSATLSWKFENEPIEPNDDRYEIYGGVSYGSLLVHTDKKTEFEIFGTYTCEARNTLGSNYINIYLEEATAPGALSQIVFAKVTPTSITFRLLGPSNTGGAPITHYVIKYRNADESEQADALVEWEKGQPYVVSGLKPRAKYHFSASARNEVGAGPWKSVNYVMPEAAVPEPPTLVLATQDKLSDFPDRYLVRWEVPNDNGAPLTHFHVRYFQVDLGRGGWTQTGRAVERTIHNWDSEPSCQLTGLLPDSFYRVEVRAANRIGSSLPDTVVIKSRPALVTNGMPFPDS